MRIMYQVLAKRRKKERKYEPVDSDRSRTQVYYGRLLRVNLHRFRTEPRDYLALIRDIIKTFERVLFGPVIRGSWPNYYIKC